MQPPKIQTRQSTTLFAIFNLILLLILSGCAGVKRPDALICGINSKAMKLRCYNIKTDFDNNGARKPDSKPIDKSFSSIHDLNGGIYLSPTDFEKVKVWLSDVRDWSKNHCQ